MEDITYEEAQQAKKVLVKYLEEVLERVEVIEASRNHNESLVYLALTQDYFLD